MAAKCSKICCLQHVRKHLIIYLLVASMLAAIITGVILQVTKAELTSQQLFYINFPGQILMRMLKMLIIPLITSSLISGTSALSSTASGKIGGRALGFYMATTIIAVCLGLLMVLTISPGTVSSSSKAKEITGKAAVDGHVTVQDTVLDLLINCFPDNLVLAASQQTYTKYINKTSNGTFELIPGYATKDGTNILGLVIFSIIFGIIIGRMKEGGKPLKDFFECLMNVTMKLVTIAIWYAPIGIYFLIVGMISKEKDLLGLLEKVGAYMGTVLGGLAIHAVIILPLIYSICVRKLPFKFLGGMSKALVTAFATASSSATLPITFECLEKNNHIDSRIVRTVVPIGATVNMDGTALYEAVAAIFIAQLEGIDLNAGKIIVISLTATLASIGAAGIPQAGIVTMAMVLTAVGLPLERQAVILTVDWFLDRFRTAVNVWGDSIGAGIVYHFSKKELEEVDRRQELERKNDIHMQQIDEKGLYVEPENSVSKI